MSAAHPLSRWARPVLHGECRAQGKPVKRQIGRDLRNGGRERYAVDRKVPAEGQYGSHKKGNGAGLKMLWKRRLLDPASDPLVVARPGCGGLGRPEEVSREAEVI